ncbi:MAG: transposase [Candidatus Njordarchaeales archaeon]
MKKYIGWEALKLLALVLHAIYGQIYPKYSKHGQRKMTIPQKMTIITIAKALGYTYREMETLARELREVLGIKRVTTFQNLHTFAKKIKPREIQDIIEAVTIIILKNRTRELGVLIDSTGFQIMDATSYYNYRAQRAADFFKLHVVMDEEMRVIILATPSDRYCHDSEPFWSYFLPELERLSKVFGFRIRYVSADSAYASNKAYREVRKRLNAIPGIKPCRRRGVPRRGLMAAYWTMRGLPWFRRYSNARWVLEAMFKVFKRLFGCYVRGRSWLSRCLELLFKVLAWNVLILLGTLWRSLTG